MQIEFSGAVMICPTLCCRTERCLQRSKGTVLSPPPSPKSRGTNNHNGDSSSIEMVMSDVPLHSHQPDDGGGDGSVRNMGANHPAAAEGAGLLAPDDDEAASAPGGAFFV